MITYQTELITPEIAQKYLDANTKNYRRMNADKVASYATDMLAGRWQTNCEPIHFYDDGVLANGQHRLQAVLLSGVPQIMTVVRGLDPSVSIFDCGKKRSTYQILESAGLDRELRQSYVSAAAATFICGKYKPVHVSNAAIEEFLSEYGDFLIPISEIFRLGTGHPICRKAAVFVAAVCLRVNGADEDLLAEFFRVVNSGFQSQDRDSSPAIVLRNYLLAAGGNTGVSDETKRKKQYSFTVSAFQDFQNGVPRRRYYSLSNDALSLFEKVRHVMLSPLEGKTNNAG